MTKNEAIEWLKLERKARSEISKDEGILPALDMAIESLSADIQKYETFCGVPMEEAYKVMRGYSLGEYAEVVQCKYCQHHGMSDCPMCEGAITEDYMWCSHGKRKSNEY